MSDGGLRFGSHRQPLQTRAAAQIPWRVDLRLDPFFSREAAFILDTKEAHAAQMVQLQRDQRESFNEFIRGNKPLIRELKNLQRGELFHPQIAGDAKDDGSGDLTNPHWR